MKTVRRLFLFAAALAAVAGAGWSCLPKPPLLDGISFSRRVFDRNGKLLAVTLTDDDKYRIFTPLAEVSPALIRATLAQEDRFFDKHPGVNPVSVARAAWHFGRG